MLETDARDRVIVALDCDRERALELAHELSGHAAWLKVGMTLYYAEGPEIVKTFKDLGFKVFLDLKFHDISASGARCRPFGLACRCRPALGPRPGFWCYARCVP